MTTPLEFGDAAMRSQVALPSEVDVGRPAKGGEAEADATDDEICRAKSRSGDVKLRHDDDTD